MPPPRPRRSPVLALPAVLAVLTGCSVASGAGSLRPGPGPVATGTVMPQATVNVSQLAKNPEPAAPGWVIVQDGTYSYTPAGARQPGPWTALTHVHYLIAVAPGTIVELRLHDGRYKPAVSGRPTVLEPIGSGEIRFHGVLWDVARFRAGGAGSTTITAAAPPCNELAACTAGYRVVIQVRS